MQFDELGNLFEGGLNNQLAASFNGVFKKYDNIKDMQNVHADMFRKQMHIISEGTSEFTMAQIRAKSASLGLTDSLTAQVVAMASDADFSAKAATGKLTWKKAISDSKIGADDLIDSLLKLDNIDENSLNKLNSIKTLDAKDIVKKEKIQAVVNSIDGLGDSIVDLGSAGTTAGKSISSVFKGMAASIAPILPLIAGVGAGLVALYGVHKYLNRFNDAVEKSAESFSAYKEASSELENLKNQSTDIKSQLESIAGKYNISLDGIDDVDSMISKVESVDTIELTDKADLENLRSQNIELERQIQLQQKTTNEAKKKSKEDALNAIEMKTTNDLSTKKNAPKNALTYGILMGNGATAAADEEVYEKTDIITATENEVKALEKLKEKRKKLLDKRRKNSDENKKDEIEAQIKSVESEISKFDKSISDNIATLDGLKDSLKDTSYFDRINDVTDAFNNIDLNPTEKALKNLDSFFSSSSGRNAIKEQLQDAVNSGRDLSTELSRMGLTLDDLGIDSISQLSSYLQDASKSAQDAKKSIQDYSASASDVKAAGESADQDSDWSTIQGAYKTAKELLKEGKTGTDDFQSVASFLNPTVVKDEIEKAKKNGGYIADAYQKAFEKSKKYADRWFGEDEAKSMKNFVNDFKKEGLFDVSTDSKGLWDIDAKFKTTAEAANEFGMSVQSIETMLHGLEAYGYDFGDLIFSTDGLSRYETALNGLKQIQKEIGSERLDKLFSGETKDKNFEGWDSEYAKISDDLSTLTEPQIIKIEFEYSLAQIQQEISRLQNLANEGGDSQTWAELNANKRAYRDKSESREGNKLATDVEEYKQTSDTIIALQDQMKNATTDAQKVAIQEQISGLYELQNAMNDTFADSGLSWDKFIKTDEYKDKISEIVSSSQEAKETVADLLGIDVEDIKIGVDADTSKAKEKLEEIAGTELSEKIVDIVGEDHASEVINIWNGLEADPKFTELSAEDKANVVLNLWNAAQANPKWSTLSAEDKATAILNAYNALEEDDKNSLITQTGGETAIGVANGVNSAINAIPKSKTSTITVKKITETITKVIGGKYDPIHTGGGMYPKMFNGTAHAIGTANRMVSKGNAYATGDWSVKKSEKALVGELGQETIVRNGKYFTVGDNGAEFADIRNGDIIFNH